MLDISHSTKIQFCSFMMITIRISRVLVNNPVDVLCYKMSSGDYRESTLSYAPLKTAVNTLPNITSTYIHIKSRK